METKTLYLLLICIMIVTFLVLTLPVKTQDCNQLLESENGTESSDGRIMPVGIKFVLIFYRVFLLICSLTARSR